MLTDRYVEILMGQSLDDELVNNAASPSAVFGSVSRMASTIQQQTHTHRISVYPCIGAGDAGTGLLLSIGYLLSLAAKTKFYPMILRITETNQVSADPFTPNEWVLDNLDDDTAIWGELTQVEGQWNLKVFVEDDVSEGELWVLEKKSSDWGGLLDLVPVIASEIADKLGLEFPLALPKATPVVGNEVEVACAALFTFTRDVFMELLREDAGNFPSTLSLIQNINTLRAEIFTSVGVTALAYGIQLGEKFGLVGTEEGYSQLHERLTEWQGGVAFWGLSALESGIASSSILRWSLEQLEAVVGENQTNIRAWLVLALFYSRMERPDLSVDVCQRALESDIQDSAIYFHYVDVLSEVLENGLRVERLILTDSAVSDVALHQERLLSLERGVSGATKPNTTRIAQWVVELAKQAQFDETAQIFQRLAELDEEGHEVDSVIQQLAYLDNTEWMIEPLKQVAQKGKFTPLLNLARALFLNGDSDECNEVVERVLAVATKPHQRSDAQMLRLELELPSVQADLADIVGRVQRANGEVYERDLEFLEYLVENAPDYAEGYLVLAAAYRRLDEPNTALEVLLDAEKVTQGTPEIYLALAELFEQEDELSLAIENIRKGIDLAPMSVPLLAQAALLAYLSGDEVGSQVFLRQAHAITPYHPRIVAVTRRIQHDEISDDDDENL